MAVFKQVGVVAVADEMKYPILDRCLRERVVPLSNRTRLLINRFIDGLEKESGKSVFLSLSVMFFMSFLS